MPALDNLAKLPRRAMARAINKTLSHARTQSIKEIRGKYTISAGDLRPRITIGRASATTLSGYIEVKTEKTRLGYFSPSSRIVQSRRGKRVGVSVKVKRDGPRKVVRIGFQPLRNIGTSQRQQRLVFKITGKKKISSRGKRKGKKIDEILPMASISYAAAFKVAAEEKLYQILDQDLYEKFNTELENYLSYERSKK